MKYHKFSMGVVFTIFSLLAFFSIVVTFLSFQHASSGVFGFLASYHLVIMLITISIALVYGFFIAFLLFKQVEKEQQVTGNMLELVMNFLSAEEKMVIKHLIECSGKSNQAAISRIGKMGGVKALRTVQKMQQKNIIMVTKQGKMRIVELQADLQRLLMK